MSRTFLALLTLVILLSACTQAAAPATTPAVESQPATQTQDTEASSGTRLRVATTTSLDDTGLWEELEPLFEERYGVDLDIISGGTGRALELGMRGDVDVLTIHDRAREEQFIADGYGTERHVIAYNYFVLIGPPSDPAGIKEMAPEEAFMTLMEEGQANPAEISFASRGDESSTHAREKALWQASGHDYEAVRQSGDWYIESGTGMGATLVLANERSAYTLSDIGTFLSYQGELDLEPMVESGASLLNVYSVIPISAEKLEGINSDDAAKLVEFLMSDEVQDIIDSYGMEEYGVSLFSATRGQEPSE